MLRQSLWLAPHSAVNRALTSGTLDQFTDGSDDRVALYCDGRLVTTFSVPRDRGEPFLRDCGLERQ
jgi:hypothetical protein